jgi:hypothetical protein
MENPIIDNGSLPFLVDKLRETEYDLMVDVKDIQSETEKSEGAD